jgi:hypothetical protein
LEQRVKTYYIRFRKSGSLKYLNRTNWLCESRICPVLADFMMTESSCCFQKCTKNTELRCLDNLKCLKILCWWIIVYFSTPRLHRVVMTTGYCLYSWWRWRSESFVSKYGCLQSNMICSSNLHFELVRSHFQAHYFITMIENFVMVQRSSDSKFIVVLPWQWR